MMAFFEGMGMQFTNVVSLIVAGEVFAQGLKAIGSVDTLISAVQSSGFHGITMVLILTVFILFLSIIMGSGAPVYSFGSLVPKMAEGMGMSSLAMIIPLQLTSGIGRMMSPISGAMIAESSIAGISPFDLVKRTFVPMLAGAITTTVMSIIVTM
jgi:DcuC family C4-dicarboxylate transporter